MDLPELWTALLSGQYDSANQMICSGANVNEPIKIDDGDGVTLLHYAVEKSDVQCIHVLANLGANFNARDCWSQTPLHLAGRFNVGPDVVELLINHGAFVDARDRHNMTPLHLYTIHKKCYIESVQKLIARGASLEAVDHMGGTALHMAAWSHNLEMVKMLISHGVSIDTKDNHGRTPLLIYFSENFQMHMLAGENKMEIIQLLLDNGADANSKAVNGVFPLLFAAQYNDPTSIRLLLRRGARVNETKINGDTALHMACKRRLADVTALLLEFGADLNALNEEGNTPCELLPSDPSSKYIAKIIIKEAVKREALGQSLCEGYKQMAQSCEKYSKFELECREEVKRMQSEKINVEDSAISFFYILSIAEEKLSALARNERIVTAFESSGYMASFRIYAGELTTKFEAAKKRANFLISVEDFLNDVLGDILPAPIVQKIAAHLKYGSIIENGL